MSCCMVRAAPTITACASSRAIWARSSAGGAGQMVAIGVSRVR